MSYLDNNLVFIGGATGLAGFSVLKCLLEQHSSVRIRACTHVHTEPRVQDERVEYISGDLRIQEDCRRMLAGCDCAIMAAATTGGARQLVSEPWKQVNDNLIMNAQVLEACCFAGVQRLVCVGSATLYQEFDGYIREDELDLNLDPHPAYWGIGWVTRFVEKLCHFWHQQQGLEVVMVRASNMFGPYARFDPETSNFIPAIIRKAVNRMEPFEVWGSPDVIRDVVYSEDFASAIVMMLNSENIKLDVFNIGSGVKTSVGDVVDWSLKYAGHKPSAVRYLTDKPTTSKFRALDCSKARQVLRWQPLNTVELGINKTVSWWRENKSWWSK